MDYIKGILLTNHKDFMEYIFERFEVKYVKNSIEGVALYNQYQYGEITLTQDERTITFVEEYWKNGVKTDSLDIMTSFRIGNFGIAGDIVEKLINHFGGCAKTDKGLLFYNDMDKSQANQLLKGI